MRQKVIKPDPGFRFLFFLQKSRPILKQDKIYANTGHKMDAVGPYSESEDNRGLPDLHISEQNNLKSIITEWKDVKDGLGCREIKTGRRQAQKLTLLPFLQ